VTQTASIVETPVQTNVMSISAISATCMPVKLRAALVTELLPS